MPTSLTSPMKGWAVSGTVGRCCRAWAWAQVGLALTLPLALGHTRVLGMCSSGSGGQLGDPSPGPGPPLHVILMAGADHGPGAKLAWKVLDGAP